MRYEQLEESLEQDLGWRKREISTLILLAKTTSQEVLLKSIILLLYAHWEGFVKRSSKIYLKYISEARRNLNELTDNFKAVVLKNLIQQCLDSKESLTLQNEVNVLSKLAKAERVKFKIPVNLEEDNEEDEFDESNDFDNKIINTYSNLNPKIYKNILSIIGLCYKDQLVSKERYIDSHLLGNRNLIGHGSPFKLDADNDFNLEIKDIERLRDIIFSIVENFKEEILEYAKEQYYLKKNDEKMKEFLAIKDAELEKIFTSIDSKYS